MASLTTEASDADGERASRRRVRRTMAMVLAGNGLSIEQTPPSTPDYTAGGNNRSPGAANSTLDQSKVELMQQIEQMELEATMRIKEQVLTHRASAARIEASRNSGQSTPMRPDDMMAFVKPATEAQAPDEMSYVPTDDEGRANYAVGGGESGMDRSSMKERFSRAPEGHTPHYNTGEDLLSTLVIRPFNSSSLVQVYLVLTLT